MRPRRPEWATNVHFANLSKAYELTTIYLKRIFARFGCEPSSLESCERVERRESKRRLCRTSSRSHDEDKFHTNRATCYQLFPTFVFGPSVNVGGINSWGSKMGSAGASGTSISELAPLVEVAMESGGVTAGSSLSRDEEPIESKFAMLMFASAFSVAPPPKRGFIARNRIWLRVVVAR